MRLKFLFDLIMINGNSIWHMQKEIMQHYKARNWRWFSDLDWFRQSETNKHDTSPGFHVAQDVFVKYRYHSGNKVVQFDYCPTIWPCPTPRSMWCHWGVSYIWLVEQSVKVWFLQYHPNCKYHALNGKRGIELWTKKQTIRWTWSKCSLSQDL